MKGLLIGVLIVLVICGAWWFYDNTKACYFAKGTRAVIESVVNVDGRPVLSTERWQILEGDRRACSLIGETL